MATILDGKKLGQEIKTRLAGEIDLLKKVGVTPGLAVILVGQNPASRIYVKNKRKACEEVGVIGFDYDLPESSDQKDIVNLIKKLNADKNVHGILVQLPLPPPMDEKKILELIDAAKDVDGFHPTNMGKLLIGMPSLRPCTALGVMELIDSIDYEIAGRHAVVVGRSHIVGKPTALMLLERNATVTMCHSKTSNLPDVIRSADIIVAAIGKPRFIKGEWIKKGAIVIDVGINRTSDGKLVGDVDFEEASKRASAITPVPGGIGPMTIAMLLKNVVEAAKQCVSV